MIRGIYTSGLGMMRESKRLDVVSNNLANASTTAFKSDGSVCGTFKKALNDVMVSGSRIDIANYTPDVVNTYTNFTQGSLYSTGNTTDLAISNDDNAFFTVENSNGDRLYTRDGAFIIDKDNYLVTAQGHKVLGTNELGEEQYIKLDSNEFGVSVTGKITAGNEVLGNLLITSFENPESLSKIGNNLIEASNASITRDFDGEIQQSYLEMSNVNTVSEMVNMIAISRAYEANQKVLQSQDEILGRAVSDVGRV